MTFIFDVKACTSAVLPALFERFGLARAARSIATPSSEPLFDASIRAVVPCSVCKSRSAECVISHFMSRILPLRAKECNAPTPRWSWAFTSAFICSNASERLSEALGLLKMHPQDKQLHMQPYACMHAYIYIYIHHHIPTIDSPSRWNNYIISHLN